MIESGLDHDPDAETFGMLTLNKAAILNLCGQRDEAIGLLGELVLAANTTANVAAIAKAVLFDLSRLGEG